MEHPSRGGTAARGGRGKTRRTFPGKTKSTTSVTPSAGPPSPASRWEGRRRASEEEKAARGVGPRTPHAQTAPGLPGPTEQGPRRPRRRPSAAPLTSSAWPSSRSKVTTHTHSSQAEKRAQGAAAARAPGDAAPRRPRARRGPARDSASMAAGTAPAARCRGNRSEALPGEQPGGGGLGTGRDRAAEQSSGRLRPEVPAAASAPLAAGGVQCGGAAPSSPERRARSGQRGQSQEEELPGRAVAAPRETLGSRVRRGSGIPGAQRCGAGRPEQGVDWRLEGACAAGFHNQSASSLTPC